MHHVHIVRALLDAGASVDTANKFGWTPLERAIHFKRIDVAQLLIDRGSRVENVKLDKYFPNVPDWVTAIADLRLKCRLVSIIIIGIHKYRLTEFTGNNDINVLKLISKHIWSTRMESDWKTQLE
jgi:hypothetical protein